MAKNIEINYNNGGGYDVLYPKTDIANTVGTLPISRTSGNIDLSNRTSGTLPLSKGGTGKISASSAIANLIYNGSNVSSLSGSNKIGVATSTSNGGGITVTNLVNYIKSNMGNSGGDVAIETKSYIGDGQSDSELIFPSHSGLTIKFIFILAQEYDDMNVMTEEYYYWHMASIPLLDRKVERTAQVKVNCSEDTRNLTVSYVGANAGSRQSNYIYEVPSNWNQSSIHYRAVAFFGK